MIVKTKLSEQAEQFELDGSHYVGRRVVLCDSENETYVESFFRIKDGRQEYAKRMILFQLDYDRGLVFVDPAILRPYQRPERLEKEAGK